MLILSRKINEQIVIGDKITVTIVAIRGGNVRLGVEVPKEMSVHRREVYNIIQREKLNPQSAGNKSLEATAQQSAPAKIIKLTPYEQFRTELDKEEYAEAGRLYSTLDRNFEVSHTELDKLTKGLYGLVQKR